MRAGVLVTGATGVLGRAVVHDLLQAGREVTGTWLLAEERDRLEQEIEGRRDRLTLVEADLSDPAAARAAVSAAGDSLGAVVHLVGGYGGGAKVGDSDPGMLDRMVSLNLRPLYLVAEAAMPVLAAAGEGALVAVSARAAFEPRGGDAAYAASKAAVAALVRSLHAEYRQAGVRSNAIVPNVIDTPQNRAAMPRSDRTKWAQPEEIARVVRFLVSDDSAVISGATVPVYGRA